MKNTKKTKSKVKSDFERGFKTSSLRKMMRKVMDKKMGVFVGGQSKKLLKDSKYFPEELCDYLIIKQPESEEGFVEEIDVWLHLETVVTGNERIKYKYGKGKDVFNRVEMQRILFLVLGSN